MQPVIVYKHVPFSWYPIAERYNAELLENGVSLFLVMVWLQLFKGAVPQVVVCLDLEFLVLPIVSLAECIDSFLGHDFLEFMSYPHHKRVALRYVLNENLGIFKAFTI